MGFIRPLVLLPFVTVAALLPRATLIAQSGPTVYTSDNSDWWSYTRIPDGDDAAVMQDREPSGSNFQILGIKLGYGMLDVAASSLGKTSIVHRGDAATARSQACYSSKEPRGEIYLVLEEGEVNSALYMFSGGPHWKGSDLCTQTNLVAKDLSTASGLHLGQTIAQVKDVLGMPSILASNKLIYSLSVQKKTSAADFEKAKRSYPELNQDQLHSNYDFYTLFVHIEARFLNGYLAYLAISKSETY